MARERQWVFVPDMPAEICGAAALAFNGKLLIIGGTGQTGQTLRTVQQYDPEDCTWKGLPNLLTARTECMATVLIEIDVIGGQHIWGLRGQPVLSVERCHQLQCWKPFGSLPCKLQYQPNYHPAPLHQALAGYHRTKC